MVSLHPVGSNHFLTIELHIVTTVYEDGIFQRVQYALNAGGCAILYLGLKKFSWKMKTYMQANRGSVIVLTNVIKAVQMFVFL